jgi:hypothetical protein
MALSQQVESSRAVIEPRAEGTPFLLDIAAKDRAKRHLVWCVRAAASVYGVETATSVGAAPM